MLPLELKELRPRAFYNILELYKERLYATDSFRIDVLEHEFKEFKRVVNSDHASVLRAELGGGRAPFFDLEGECSGSLILQATH